MPSSLSLCHVHTSCPQQKLNSAGIFSHFPQTAIVSPVSILLFFLISKKSQIFAEFLAIPNKDYISQHPLKLGEAVWLPSGQQALSGDVSHPLVMSWSAGWCPPFPLPLTTGWNTDSADVGMGHFCIHVTAAFSRMAEKQARRSWSHYIQPNTPSAGIITWEIN